MNFNSYNESDLEKAGFEWLLGGDKGAKFELGEGNLILCIV